jgi:hypothetical protein
VFDGEEVDTSGMNEVETNYVKTANLLMGKSLYSHSWLKL